MSIKSIQKHTLISNEEWWNYTIDQKHEWGTWAKKKTNSAERSIKRKICVWLILVFAIGQFEWIYVFFVLARSPLLMWSLLNPIQTRICQERDGFALIHGICDAKAGPSREKPNQIRSNVANIELESVFRISSNQVAYFWAIRISNYDCSRADSFIFPGQRNSRLKIKLATQLIFAFN